MPDKAQLNVHFNYFDGIGIIPEQSDSYSYRKLAGASIRKNTSISRKFSKYNSVRELTEAQVKISGMICIIRSNLI
jgi:hypothetical protein